MDLSTAISNLEAASTGEDIRTAIVNLLNSLYKVEGDVEYLNHIPWGQFVLRSSLTSGKYPLESNFEKYMNTIPEPKPAPSTAYITGGNLFTYFSLKDEKTWLDHLKSINGDSKGRTNRASADVIGSDIQECLSILYTTFFDSDPTVGIKEAIENAGGTVPSTDSIMDFAKRIEQMETGQLNVVQKDFTDPADNGHVHYPPLNTAWNPVNVNLQYKIYPLLTVTKNGTYNPYQPQYDYSNAFGSVKIEIPVSNPNSRSSGGGGGGGTGEETSYNLFDGSSTTNGIFYASSEEGSPDAYSSFDTTNVREYYIDPDKRFTVKFEVEGEIVKTVENVKPGESLIYEDNDHPTPTKSTYTGDIWCFNGWNPPPVHILADMTCVAEFTRWLGKPTIKSSLAQGNYLDGGWEDICDSGGKTDGERDIQPGDIKPLYIPELGIFRMQCVARENGEGNTVWISKDVINNAYAHSSASLPYPFQGLSNGVIDSNKPWSWNNSVVKQWFNTTFLSWLPECLRTGIKAVPKYNIAWTGSTHIWEGSNDNRIWIPSLKEMNVRSVGEVVTLGSQEFEIPEQGADYKSMFSYFKGDSSGKLWGKPNFTGKSWTGNSSFWQVMDAVKRDLPENYKNQNTAILNALLPHSDTIYYNYYNDKTSEWEWIQEFDSLKWEIKVAQFLREGSGSGRPLTVPDVDWFLLYAKFSEDIPSYAKKNNDTRGVTRGSMGGEDVSYGLRDSYLPSGTIPYMFSMNPWSYAGNGYMGNGLPSIQLPSSLYVRDMAVNNQHCPFRFGFVL